MLEKMFLTEVPIAPSGLGKTVCRELATLAVSVSYAGPIDGVPEAQE